MQTNSDGDKTFNAVKVAETSFGKAISITRGRDGRMFLIVVEGGGTKPTELDGHFTHWDAAEAAIKLYVDSGNGRYVAKADAVKHPKSMLPSTTKRPKLKMGGEQTTVANKPGEMSFMAEPSNADPGDAVAE